GRAKDGLRTTAPAPKGGPETSARPVARSPEAPDRRPGQVVPGGSLLRIGLLTAALARRQLEARRSVIAGDGSRCGPRAWGRGRGGGRGRGALAGHRLGRRRGRGSAAVIRHGL